MPVSVTDQDDDDDILCNIFVFRRGEFFSYKDGEEDLPPTVAPRIWDRQKFHYDNVSFKINTFLFFT